VAGFEHLADTCPGAIAAEMKRWPPAGARVRVLIPHPEERAARASRRMQARLWPYGSPGDAKHRPETRRSQSSGRTLRGPLALLTMRGF